MDKKFSKYLDQLNIQTSSSTSREKEQLYQKIMKQATVPPSSPRKKTKIKPLIAVAAACLLIVIGIIIVPAQNQKQMAITDNYADKLIYAAADYGEIYAKIITNFASDATTNFNSNDSVVNDNIQEEASADNGILNPQSSAENNDTNSDFSQTNNQVSGVDEGDIVKTDGDHIYMLRDQELIILAANGAVSDITARIKLPTDTETENYQTYQYATELYVSGDYLAVVINSWTANICFETSSASDYIVPEPTTTNDITKLLIYDIGDSSQPQLLNTIGQDGTYLNSRLIENTLYLISQYLVYDDMEQNHPETFVPSTYCNDQQTVSAAEDVYLLPDIESNIYTVISAIDLEKQETKANVSVLGGGDTVYMNHNNLYIVQGKFATKQGSAYTEDQYSVVDYQDKTMSQIMRFSLNDGDVVLAASGEIPGTIESQFSLDEYNGYLRAVTTIDEQYYKIYTDNSHGWENYVWDEDSSQLSNSLWVLDQDLKVVGSIENLAEEERIYSARFAGDIGYFVTFKQVDPLFAIDLSNPSSPQILSQLKIPGFSEYLHPYSEGRLFGLGMDADEESGTTQGMKLTMFDTSDPANVTEKHTLLLDESYSPALYNHKAILISAEHNLIAFPVEDGYSVYGYNDSSGFYQRGFFATDTGEGWQQEQRGLYIDNNIYICAYNCVTIVDMDNLNNLANISL